MGHKELSLLVPYLTPNMTKRALRQLVKSGIVRTFNLNDNPFDNTYWYAFTAFGSQLMLTTSFEED
jgi:DNA-binding HxlR family transcriptional regulator